MSNIKVTSFSAMCFSAELQVYFLFLFCLVFFERETGKIELLEEKGNFGIGHAEKNHINSLCSVTSERIKVPYFPEIVIRAR